MNLYEYKICVLCTIAQKLYVPNVQLFLFDADDNFRAQTESLK